MTQAAEHAERSIIQLATLVANNRRLLLAEPRATPASHRLFELLPVMPRFTIARVAAQLGTSVPTATAAVRVLQGLGIVLELTGLKKNRCFGYEGYVGLLMAQ